MRLKNCAPVAVIAVLLVSSFGSGTLSAESLFREGRPEIKADKIADGDPGAREFPHFAGLVKDLSAAVVNISVEGEGESDGDEAPVPNLPFFKKDPDRQALSLGSGFIINPKGIIVTNNHVIDKAKRIIVRLLDDRNDYDAKLIGKDLKTDLALLQIDAKKSLPAVFLGDSDKIEVGEWVIAIGNQFQLGQTVTAGIVSAKSRKVPSPESGPYDSFIQTDASINPGSSGGPLFNTRGQVIGINTAIFSPGRTQSGSTGFNIGIGFAIPINIVKSIVTQLRDSGKVTRGMLGVIIQPVDKDVAEALGLNSPDGALVADIVSGSPASRAGFERRDVIVKFAGHDIHDHDDLPLMVATTPIGTESEIEVLRNGKIVTLRATIEELKELTSGGGKSTEPAAKVNELGLGLKPVPEDRAKASGIQAGQGVFVESVQAGSAAFRAGFARGDIIEEVGGMPVRTVEGFEALVKSVPKKKAVLVLVRRKEGTRFLTLKPR